MREQTGMKNIQRSLKDLLTEEYIEAVCEAGSFLTGRPKRQLLDTAEEQVDFYPEWFQRRQEDLLSCVGEKVVAGTIASARGAGSNAFIRATRKTMSPLAGLGVLKIGEDGRLYLASKSEHYHASLGHGFPGFKLLDHAKDLGISNITHNNTRGFITRRIEEELIRVAHGIPKTDPKALEAILNSDEPHVLNRVINLQTGSLVVEAALKMALSRFYRFQDSDKQPRYSGKTPVILVVGDEEGGKSANYHGTTMFTQMMRGLWPDMYRAFETNDVFRIIPVKINDIADFRRAVSVYNSGTYKAAGFFHELVLMNYGAIRIEKDYIREAHAICHEHGIPIIIDEIQTSIWYPDHFLFRDYGLKPDLVSVGKGFPAGQYSAAKILFTSEMDTLSQFGALVTNGQEEIASLAYLITLEFAEENKEHIRNMGRYYKDRLKQLASKHSDIVTRIEGCGHLSSLFFTHVEAAARFAEILNGKCIDISAHTYKTHCAPSALTKLPLITSHRIIDFLIAKMDETLTAIRKEN